MTSLRKLAGLVCGISLLGNIVFAESILDNKILESEKFLQKYACPEEINVHRYRIYKEDSEEMHAVEIYVQNCETKNYDLIFKAQDFYDNGKLEVIVDIFNVYKDKREEAPLKKETIKLKEKIGI